VKIGVKKCVKSNKSTQVSTQFNTKPYKKIVNLKTANQRTDINEKAETGKQGILSPNPFQPFQFTNLFFRIFAFLKHTEF
jgi:hypothetical protein